MFHDVLEELFAVPRSALAVRSDRPGEYRLVDMPVHPPAAGEVLIRVAAAGICGSDVELLTGMRPPEIVNYPVVPGHEWSGWIVEVGAEVAELRVGQPVVAEGLRWCGTCARCREGATNLCLAGYRETGFTEPGAFSEYVTVPARLVHPLAEGVAMEGAALLEPTACMVSALWHADTRPGQRALVIGGGTLGQLALQLLAAREPEELLLVDDRADRRELARRFGASATLSIDELAEQSVDADIVVEVANGPGAAAAAVRSTRHGGTVVLGGIAGRTAAPLDPTEITVRELHLHGLFGARSQAWAEAVRAYGSGALDLTALISHRFPLAEFGSALATAQAQELGTGKVLLLPGGQLG